VTPFSLQLLLTRSSSSQAWVDRIAARPAAQRGIDIPEKSQYNPNMSKEEQDKKAEEAKQWIHKK
jgi:endonuclease YncB( thermonuclease family)